MAEANAIGNSEITAGTTLKVPDVGQSKNDATTFKPYNPAETVGNTSPTLPYMAEPKDCNMLAMAIMIVVAIVVTVVTYGAAAPYLSSLFSFGATMATTTGITLAGAVAGGFVAGVAGSIASQVVGKALGVVDHFSLRQAVGSGIAGGLTAGIGVAFGGAEGLSGLIESGKWGKVAAAATLSATSGYVANKIAGVPDTHFSWKSIAVNAVTDFVTKALLGAKPSDAARDGVIQPSTNEGFVGRVATEFGRAMVSRMVRSAAEVVLTGKSVGDNDLGQLLADAFGNALGQAIVGTMGANKQLKSMGMSRADYRSLQQTNATFSSLAANAQPQQVNEWGSFDLEAALDNLNWAANGFADDIQGSATTFALGEDSERATTTQLSLTPRARKTAVSIGGHTEVAPQGGREADGLSMAQIQQDAYRGHKALLGAQFTNRISAPNRNWNAERQDQWNAELYSIHGSLPTHRDEVQFPVAPRPVEVPQSFLDDRLEATSIGMTNLVQESKLRISDSDAWYEAAGNSAHYAILSVTNEVVSPLADSGRIFTNSNVRADFGQGVQHVLTTDPRTTIDQAWKTWREYTDEQRLSKGAAGLATLLAVPTKASALTKVDIQSASKVSRMAELQAKYGSMTVAEKRMLLESKVEINAERWLRQKEVEYDAHFVDKHGADIPLDPNLKQRSIDGAHPRTPWAPGNFPQPSSQFKDWRTQMHIINEATTRSARGLDEANYFINGDINRPAVVGSSDATVGWGFTKNTADLSNPNFHPEMFSWIVPLNSNTYLPYTAYPTR